MCIYTLDFDPKPREKTLSQPVWWCLKSDPLAFARQLKSLRNYACQNLQSRKSRRIYDPRLLIESVSLIWSRIMKTT